MILVEKQLGTPICRWKDNIKMDLREVRRVVWTGLIWLRIRIILGLL
jgi:hypothetical protein